jgi:hypothetical protein
MWFDLETTVCINGIGFALEGSKNYITIKALQIGKRHVLLHDNNKY